MSAIKHHVPFIQSILKEANRFKRQEKIRHANKDQINALSEITLNLLKKNIPVSQKTVGKFKPHKNLLRAMSKKNVSVKQRKKLLMKQRGGTGLWTGLSNVCQCIPGEEQKV